MVCLGTQNSSKPGWGSRIQERMLRGHLASWIWLTQSLSVPPWTIPSTPTHSAQWEDSAPNVFPVSTAWPNLSLCLAWTTTVTSSCPAHALKLPSCSLYFASEKYFKMSALITCIFPPWHSSLTSSYPQGETQKFSTLIFFLPPADFYDSSLRQSSFFIGTLPHHRAFAHAVPRPSYLVPLCPYRHIPGWLLSIHSLSARRVFPDIPPYIRYTSSPGTLWFSLTAVSTIVII